MRIVSADVIALENGDEVPVGAAQVPTYTLETLPALPLAGQLGYLSDETVLVFSDGTNWRRTTDKTVVVTMA